MNVTLKIGAGCCTSTYNYSGVKTIGEAIVKHVAAERSMAGKLSEIAEIVGVEVRE